MSGAPWFKCFPQDLLNGMAGMPADERGIYISVLCLIYREGGPIRDDAREMAYNTGCTVKSWTKYRAALILHGKLYVVQVNGRDHLMNERCHDELEALKERSAKNSENGFRGGKKKAQNKTGKANENNVDALATAKPPLSEGLAILDTDIEGSDISPDGDTSDAAASRDPSDFDGRAWDEAVRILTGAGLPEKQARAFFGKLLAENRLLPRDMLPALTQADITGTPELQAYLSAAARAIGGRRVGAKPKRVAFV